MKHVKLNIYYNLLPVDTAAEWIDYGHIYTYEHMKQNKSLNNDFYIFRFGLIEKIFYGLQIWCIYLYFTTFSKRNICTYLITIKCI